MAVATDCSLAAAIAMMVDFVCIISEGCVFGPGSISHTSRCKPMPSKTNASRDAARLALHFLQQVYR